MCWSMCVDMIRLSENIGIVANSLACEIGIVNDITNCKPCLFYVSGLFVLFCFSIVFVRMCDCVRVYLLIVMPVIDGL